jgi:microcystin-dependent protein
MPLTKVQTGLIEATGTPDATTFLRGDGAWATVTGNPTGTVLWFAANTPPTGYLKANGDAVSRTTYSALFAVIGTTFGVGDGSTTFNVPDMRGNFARGWTDGSSVDTGRVFGSTQLDQMQQITGAITNMGKVASPASAVSSGALTSGGSTAGNSGIGSGGNTGVDITFNSANSSGARTGTETRPRNVALLGCIKF